MTVYTFFVLFIGIHSAWSGSPATATGYFRIPAELSNALELLRPPDRTRFITNCFHTMYMCSKQEVKIYVWGLQDSHQFQFNNFWNWYICTKKGVKDDCPVNGGWSVWSKWGYCDVTCGPGLRSRFRKCSTPRPRNGGRICDGQTTQVTRCENNISCKQNGAVSKVHGNYLKMLHKSNPELKEKCLQSHCSYQEVRDIIVENEEADKYWTYINCLKHSEGCPVDGGWSDWGEWSRCSSNCGTGHRYHLRNCDSPRPRNGGETCSGRSVEKARCFENNCLETVGLNFSPWSHWSQCSASCGLGTERSTRRCTDGGACLLTDGTHRETLINKRPCKMPVCHRSGGWSKWSEWSMCTAICGWGTRVHTRTCTNPTPFGAESVCDGDSIESERCSHMDTGCNGTHLFPEREYSYWSQWTACKTTCAVGTMLRHRTCVDNTTKPCTGPLYDVAACNQHIPCPVDGGWSEWTQWSICSQTCDSGFTERHRLCTNPRPAFGGKICSGYSFERVKCQDGVCPNVTSTWGEWGNWTQCSATCGGGTNTRQRSCLVEDFIVENTKCGGEYRQLGACGLEACPVDGNWANWNGWRPCSMECGEGITSRDRTCTNPAPIGRGRLCDSYGTESRHCYRRPCMREHRGKTRLFGGKSFLMYRQSGHPSKQVLIYLRLQPESSDGLILMKRHEHLQQPLVYVSLLSGCVYLYAKMGSAELKVVGHPVELFKWNTIQVSITGNLGYIRVNDEHTQSGNFTAVLPEKVNYDLPLYLGGCLPHLYPKEKTKKTVWSGYVGKIAAFRLNYKSMSLVEDEENWQGTNKPFTSLNSERVETDIMATSIDYNGKQFSTIKRRNNGEDLREIQAIFTVQTSAGLLLYVLGATPDSFMSITLATNKLVLSLHLDNKVMNLERDLNEIETWIIIDIKIDPNQVLLRVNKGPVSQLSGQNLEFIPSNTVYVGGLPPWRNCNTTHGFNGHIYKVKLNDDEYFMVDMYKESWDFSIDSASTTLANNFEEHFVIHKASVQLRCSYSEYEHLVDVIWLKENEVVDPTARYTRLEEDNILLPNTTILHLHSIDEERQGMYGCQFRFQNRAEIHQAFAVSITEPHDILARTLIEWKMSVLIYFAVVAVALVFTSIAICIRLIRKRPFYYLKLVHTLLDFLGFKNPNRTTLADLRDVDATYDGKIDFKEEKKQLDKKSELSRRKRLMEAAERKIRDKKESVTDRVKKWTDKSNNVATRRVSQSGLAYTSIRYSENDNVEGYTTQSTRLPDVHLEESIPSERDLQPKQSVGLTENGNNSGTSSRGYNNQEASCSSHTGVDLQTDISYDVSLSEIGEIELSFNQTDSNDVSLKDEYTVTENEVNCEEFHVSEHAMELEKQIEPVSEQNVSMKLSGNISSINNSIVTGELTNDGYEADTLKSDSTNTSETNPIQVGTNDSQPNEDNDGNFDFKSRALQLAGLLSANGITPPMKERYANTSMDRSKNPPLEVTQTTTLVNSSPVDQVEEEETEDEYQDTHE